MSDKIWKPTPGEFATASLSLSVDVAALRAQLAAAQQDNESLRGALATCMEEARAILRALNAPKAPRLSSAEVSAEDIEETAFKALNPAALASSHPGIAEKIDQLAKHGAEAPYLKANPPTLDAAPEAAHSLSAEDAEKVRAALLEARPYVFARMERVRAKDDGTVSHVVEAEKNRLARIDAALASIDEALKEKP